MWSKRAPSLLAILGIVVWQAATSARCGQRQDGSPKQTLDTAQTGTLRLRVTGPEGGVLPRVSAIYLCDLDYVPVMPVGRVAGATTLGNLPRKPLLVSVYLEVPGFGKLDFTAANGGSGFVPAGQTLDVAYEAARHRPMPGR